jgi:MoxR-like ATPase
MTPEIQALLADLEREGYVAEPHIATAAHLARAMRKPLLVEGDAGVGKTELAKVLARLYGTELIRLQCYEGLDVQTALYEWDYPRQLLRIRMSEAQAAGAQAAGPQALDPQALEARIFSRDCLLERPLLRAITRGRPPVLLIDEIDRADDGFEAFLLELLSDFQVTIPEIGVIKAAEPPLVIITSNRTREIHDAIKRRCFYYWVDYPTAARELEILRTKVPAAELDLAREVVAFVQKLRGRELFKLPGVAETIDWADALLQLNQTSLSPEMVDNSLGALLKYQDDIQKIRGSEAAKILDEIKLEVQTARLQASLTA